MIYCPICQTSNVRMHSLDFATKKEEGQPVKKFIESKKEFICNNCGHVWISSPEAEKIFLEYKQLRDETKIYVQTVKRGQPYNPQNVDVNKLMRRKELARKLLRDCRYSLWLKPCEWHEVEIDAV